MEVEKGENYPNGNLKITKIIDDMGRGTMLDLMLQPDQDVIVTLTDPNTGKRLSCEICSPSGGGRDRGTWRLMRQLILILAGEKP